MTNQDSGQTSCGNPGEEELYFCLEQGKGQPVAVGGDVSSACGSWRGWEVAAAVGGHLAPIKAETPAGGRQKYAELRSWGERISAQVLEIQVQSC